MKFQHYILLGLLVGTIAGWLSLSKNEQPELQLYSFADAVAQAAPSVVNIYTTRVTVAPQKYQTNDPLLDYYFNDQQSYAQKQQVSLGSGVIINELGYIVTNYHVIKGAKQIRVHLYDNREALATIIGVDRDTDLAVLKITLDNLQPIKAGNPQSIRVGDPALAIGNPFGFGQTVTAGIISATGRYGLNLNTYENFIQTDAAINVGSSGGALINHKGELIGINTAFYSQQGAAQGIGLAIPTDIVYKVLDDIVQHGQVIRGWLGLEATQLNPALAEQLDLTQTKGVIITNTYENGPADNAGILPGDIILQINNAPIETQHDGLLEVANLEPGSKIEVEVIRDNQSLILTVTIGIRPNL